jgi:hypothetical protein
MNAVQMHILKEFNLKEKDVTYFRESHVGLYGIDVKRVSWFLSAQLTFAGRSKLFSPFAVTDVIQRLEGRVRGTSVKPPQPFKHDPLKGFWKAHFFTASFIVRNLINEWGLEHKTSTKFNKLVAKVSKEEDDDPSPYGWQGRLAHKLVMEGFDERARRRKLTGEWLIYVECGSERYYLCIAQHTNNEADDKKIYDLIISTCGNEFPFLAGE